MARPKTHPGAARVGLSLALSLFTASAFAASDPFAGLATPQGAGIGIVPRVERSPYRDAGTRFDFQPLHLYEGRQLYIRAHSIGLKLGSPKTGRLETFLRHRFESHPIDDLPESLAGMSPREQGIDGGIGVHIGAGQGIAYAELLRDLSTASRGAELRLGYRRPWRHNRLYVLPYATVALRSARLNDYYYGVRPGEATPTRAAYAAGAGVMPEIGLQAAYRFAGRWWLLAGANIAYLPRAIGDSPIVQHRTTHSLTLGAMYDLSPETAAWPVARPLIARAFYGGSSECDVAKIATLRCTSVHTRDNTGVVGFELGRPFIERVDGLPIDIAGFLGLIRHTERGFQPDFWQINAYLKAYFYGFPWDARLRTRLGLGVGLSYANRIPFAEQRDLIARNRNTSKLLQTLDPTVDMNLGDLLRSKPLRHTYAGLGVSHRSGIFGSSQLLGKVDGGSNYIYGYLETSF